jgi:hypothetical protein
MQADPVSHWRQIIEHDDLWAHLHNAFHKVRTALHFGGGAAGVVFACQQLQGIAKAIADYAGVVDAEASKTASEAGADDGRIPDFLDRRKPDGAAKSDTA